MSKLLAGSVLIGLVGCGQAYADRTAARRAPAPAQALAAAPVAQRSPYEVTVRREDGSTLDTFAQKGRYYVLGDAGERYVIHVTNPTAARIEAVVSVDGLDVIDGDDGDLRKRGYIVPAGGDLDIEGFRTSSEDVATFRFSSVGGSYAGRKGKARNVGVIAVALFAEKAAPEIIVNDSPPPPPPPCDDCYRYEDDLAAGHGVTPTPRPAPTRGGGAAADRQVAPSAASGEAGAVGKAAGAPLPVDDVERDEPYLPPAPMPVRPPDVVTTTVAPPTDCCAQPRSTRPGLGTEFGEQRSSAASFTRFVRASDKPIAVAELRYNDAAGLVALGIPAQGLPDAGELSTRETADPFPGDVRFSAPPR